MIRYAQAVRNLVGDKFIGGPTDGPVEKMEFKEGTTQPTEEAIQAKLKELQDEYEKQTYASSRQQEYPDLQECIHALLDGGDTLTELQSKRSEIKKKYPKLT